MKNAPPSPVNWPPTWASKDSSRPGRPLLPTIRTLRRSRLFFPALLTLTGLTAWWAAYDRPAAALRLALWLAAVWGYALLRALPAAGRSRAAAWLGALDALLALAALLSLPLPFDSDTLGGVLAVFLPFLFVSARRGARRAVAALLVAAALLKTREYGAWIGLAAACGVWKLAPAAARRLKAASPAARARLAPLGAGALFLGFLALLWNPAPLAALQRLPIPLENLHTRLEYALRTLYLIADYPLGGGFASFSGLYSRYILGIAYVFIESSHNLYLDLAQEQGLPALGVFLYLLSGSGTRAALDSEARLPRAALAAMTVLAVHGLFEAPLYTSPALPLLLLPLALAPPPPAQAPPRRILLPLLGFALLAGFLQLPATRQAQIELRSWPETRPEQTAPRALAPLKPLYARTLRLLPGYFPSEYRLGLIALLERDFPAAVLHLEAAAQRKAAHPGVRKALAYALVWNGQIDAALPLLRALPEARQDLQHYARWWPTQGREALGARALQALNALAPP